MGDDLLDPSEEQDDWLITVDRYPEGWNPTPRQLNAELDALKARTAPPRVGACERLFYYLRGGPEEERKVVAALIECFKTATKLSEPERDEIQQKAVMALSKRGPAGEEAVPHLCSSLGTSSPSVRVSIVAAIGALRLLPTTTVPALLELLRDEGHDANSAEYVELKTATIAALGAFWRGSDLRHSEADLVLRTCSALGLLLNKDAEDVSVRIAAAEALAAVGLVDESAVHALAEASCTTDPMVSQASIVALGHLTPPATARLIPRLDRLRHVQTELVDIWSEVVLGLANQGEEVGGQLVDGFRVCEHPRSQTTIVEALVRWVGGNAERGEKVATALGQLGDKAVELLKEIATSATGFGEGIRRGAIDLLYRVSEARTVTVAVPQVPAQPSAQTGIICLEPQTARIVPALEMFFKLGQMCLNVECEGKFSGDKMAQEYHLTRSEFSANLRKVVSLFREYFASDHSPYKQVTIAKFRAPELNEPELICVEKDVGTFICNPWGVRAWRLTHEYLVCMKIVSTPVKRFVYRGEAHEPFVHEEGARASDGAGA